MKGPITRDILAKKLVVESYFEHSRLEPLVAGEAAPFSYSTIYEILREQILNEVVKVEYEKNG